MELQVLMAQRKQRYEGEHGSALNAGLGVLLPCPFCGKAETAELVDSDTFQDLMPWEVEPEGHMVWWAVMCDASKPGGKGGCGASGGFAETEEDAIKRWNTRTPNNRSEKMDKEQVIEKLWENAGHGTRREDVEAAYNAGAEAEREACATAIREAALESDDEAEAHGMRQTVKVGDGGTVKKGQK